MPPSEGRAGNIDICIWFITIFLLISILCGCGLLILYITLPASTATSWFPVAGMILIGIPWAFWIFTCIYHSVVLNLSPGPTDRAPIRAASVAPASGLAASNSPRNGVDSPVDSPGGARRVRFGNATVLGSQVGTGTGTGMDAGDRESPHATSAPGLNSEGSSAASRESEQPLTRSMS